MMLSRAAGGRRTGELTSNTSGHNIRLVMPALVAGIHVFKAVPHQKAWMAGTNVQPGHDVWMGHRQRPLV